MNMDRKELLSRLNEIFIDVLDNEDIVLSESTTSNDIEEWDSLTHVHLCVEIQDELGVRFSASEMQKWKNVGEMMDSILK